MMGKHILIVGRGFSVMQRYLTEHGLTWTLLRDSKTVKRSTKRFAEQIIVDFDDKKQLAAVLDTLDPRPDGVLTMYENYVLQAAQVAEYLHLPGLPVAAARACTDKYLMRSLFAKSSEKISPQFAQVESWEEVTTFAGGHDFPLILKPANLVKSLLVFKCENLEQLRHNYKRMMATIDDVYAQYAPGRTPKVVIEEYMTGHVYSTDAFVDRDGVPHVLPQIVDYQTGYEIGYEDNFHYSRLLPTKLTPDQQRQLLHVAELGCQALGMRSSPAHIEIIMTSSGPQIVEIGARNGGYRERMYRLANGIDIYGAAVATALGEPANIAPTKNESVAVLELFPKTTGKYVGLAHEQELRQLPSLEYLSLKHKPGDMIGKAADGFKMTAIVILHHADAEQFERDLAYVNEHVYVQTEP